jgi:hypothetical protein
VGSELAAAAVPDGDADALGANGGDTVPLAVISGVGEELPAGDNEDGPAEGVDPEQAETAAEASIPMVPQPMMVSIALSPAPATVMRTFMEPPHVSRQVAAPFPSQHQKPAPEGTRVATGRWPEAGPPKAGGHKGKAHGRHRQAMT